MLCPTQRLSKSLGDDHNDLVAAGLIAADCRQAPLGSQPSSMPQAVFHSLQALDHWFIWSRKCEQYCITAALHPCQAASSPGLNLSEVGNLICSRCRVIQTLTACHYYAAPRGLHFVCKVEDQCTAEFLRPMQGLPSTHLSTERLHNPLFSVVIVFE